jgi:heme-degrading monooxygenase HmoA
MKRRNFISSAATAAVTLPLIAAASSTNADTSIVHSVYFWLKAGITPEEENTFLEYFTLLKKIPGARKLHFGKPAPTTFREVTDNTFDYNLIIVFDSMEDIQNYEQHPEHIAGAEKYKKYWRRVQVRDTLLPEVF